jgi:hypothetical protein
MSDTNLLKDHALAVRAVRFGDQVSLNSAIQRSKMLIRQAAPRKTHYIEEIDQIGFAPNCWPCEQAYELQRWAESCEELASLLETVASQLDTFGVTIESDVNRTLIQVCERFHQVALQLRSRHKGRSTLEITDEYDVQDLLHAVLRIFFDDVRSEEWVPGYAGKATRMDFLLKSEKTVIEVKKTRAGLGDADVGSQLVEDIARYKNHQDCTQLFCFVYDPEHLLRSPRALEVDLSKTHGELPVQVYIRPVL